MKLRIKNVIFLSLLAALGCSSSRQVPVKQNFDIQYYTAGGISGMFDGMTVTSDGWAKFWTGRSVVLSVITDSSRVSQGQLKRISEILNADELFTLQLSSTGDVFSVLSMRRDGKTNIIKFPGVQPPDSAPKELQSLLNELKQITKPQH